MGAHSHLGDLATAPGVPAPLFTTRAAFPTAPYDGQVVCFQNAAMAEWGITWTFRYRAGSASGYKWEFVGGEPLRSIVEAEEEVGAPAYADLGAGPKLIAPMSAEYRLSFGGKAAGFPNVAFGWLCGLWIETYAGVVREIAVYAASQGGATFWQAPHLTVGQFAITGGHLIKLQYYVINAAAKWGHRYLDLIPVRC